MNRQRTRRCRRRGDALVVAHCVALGRLTAPDRPPARRRLEQRLGLDLSRVLIRGLAGDHAARAPRLRVVPDAA